MALDKCFQVSTVCTQTRPCLRPFASIEKNHFHLPTFQGFYKSPTSSLSSSAFPSSSFACSPKGRCYDKSRFICKAREAFFCSVQEATDASWESNVIASKNPVLVEFWAPWCGPCRMIAPVIDELAKEHAGKISCYKVNTDDCPNIATRYGIRSIPTVLFFKNGEKKESVIGAVPKSTLSATIEKYVDA